MFCIHEISHHNETEKIIGIIKSKNEFVDYITNLNIKIKANIIDVITPDMLLVNNKYTNGIYLLNNVNKIELVEKYNKTLTGYVYNSVHHDIKILFTWRIIRYECHEPQNKNIILINDILLDDTSSNNSGDIILPNKKSNIVINVNKVLSNDTNNIYTDDVSDCHNDNAPEKKSDDLLPIHHFDIANMVKTPKILLCAKRGSGKSWIILNIVHNFNITDEFLKNTLIISPTECDNPFFSEYLPKVKIIYKYDSEIIEEYYNKKNGCIILDDCMASKGCLIKNSIVEKILCSNKKPIIMSMQFPLGLSPEMRNNFNYVFLLEENNVCNLKRLYDHYVNIFPYFNSFVQVFRQVTSDYGAMVIVNHSICKNFLDKIFHFKADDPLLLSKFKFII